jgi:hypothetical protein
LKVDGWLVAENYASLLCDYQAITITFDMKLSEIARVLMVSGL